MNEGKYKSSVILKICRSYLLKALLRGVFAIVVVSSFLVFTQDFQVFPAIVQGMLFDSNSSKRIPKDVDVSFIQTEDGVKIETWKLEAKNSKYAAIVFHGNGHSVEYFFDIQTWFQSLGVTSFGFDYRGYGRSEGWPSEEGVYKDSVAIWEYVTSNLNINKENIIIFGISVGSGPAAYIAEKYQPGLLVLFSPYISIEELVDDMFFISYLKPFLWYSFPTLEYVSKLKDTKLILTHGEKDSIIPVRHGIKISKAYPGETSYTYISPHANHNDLFFLTKERIGAVIQEFIKNGSFSAP